MLIEVRERVKRYGDHCAVDHLSFPVPDGSVFGFLGPNGTGKSTTMIIITGYLAATEGDVVVEGHNILDRPEAARRCLGCPKVTFLDEPAGGFLRRGDSPGGGGGHIQPADRPAPGRRHTI